MCDVAVRHPAVYPSLGAANPTVARRNMTLPGESGQNLVEWRFRKEQTRGKVIVFGRKLRVSPCCQAHMTGSSNGISSHYEMDVKSIQGTQHLLLAI